MFGLSFNGLYKLCFNIDKISTLFIIQLILKRSIIHLWLVNYISNKFITHLQTSATIICHSVYLHIIETPATEIVYAKIAYPLPHCWPKTGTMLTPSAINITQTKTASQNTTPYIYIFYWHLPPTRHKEKNHFSFSVLIFSKEIVAPLKPPNWDDAPTAFRTNPNPKPTSLWKAGLECEPVRPETYLVWSFFLLFGAVGLLYLFCVPQ